MFKNEMDNSKNSGKSILRFVFLLITLILIVWAFWPERRTIEKVPLKITSQNGLDSSDEFQLINQLNEYQVVINSPVSIEMKEMENIIILLERTSQAEGVIDGLGNYTDGALAIEISIKMPNAEIRPGSEIIESFIGQDAQIFIFNISAMNSGDYLSGNVWVYMLIYDSEDQLIERFPLLVFPMQIRLVQFWQLNPQTLKIFFAGIFLFLFLFFH